MKTKIFLSSLMSLLVTATIVAQDRTTVSATSSDISDNLDLRAVASIFGDSKDLEDFEYRLNDPKAQISNLDLNGDNQVDYLRVIESVEGNSHLIVVQSVLGQDTFQDVATIEVERDRNNAVQVQVVGDVYMYGANYIYEPVYVTTPIIYSYFWTPRYRPYYSVYYWGYYPSYYSFWNPYPVYRYRRNVNVWINVNHQYNYGSVRRNQTIYNNYYGRRSNGYERQYPNRSFASRNEGFTNRRELERARPTRNLSTGTRANAAATSRNNATRSTNGAITRNASTTRSTNATSTRSQSTSAPRSREVTAPRSSSVSTPRSQSTPSTSPRSNSSTTPRLQSASMPRNNSASAPRSSSMSTPRQSTAPRSGNMSAPSSSQNRGSNAGGQSRGNSESRGSRR